MVSHIMNRLKKIFTIKYLLNTNDINNNNYYTVNDNYDIIIKCFNCFEQGDINLLGNYTVDVNYNNIHNCYIRMYNYVDYDALTICLKKINYKLKNKTILFIIDDSFNVNNNWEILKRIIQIELNNNKIIFYDGYI